MRCRRNSNWPPEVRVDFVLHRCIFAQALRKERYGQGTRHSRDRGQLEERFDQSKGGERTCGANHHLRQSLVFLNVPAMPQPEAYIGGVDKLFDANGRLINDGTRKFLQGFMQAYAAWIAANTES